MTGVILQVDIPQLQSLIAEATQTAVTEALVSAGLLTDYISKSEAYRLYGRGTVDSWIAAGYVQAYYDDSRAKYRIRRAQLTDVAKRCNVKPRS